MVRRETIDGELRLVTEGKINGRTVRLVADTGNEAAISVFASTARRLKLQVPDAPASAPAAGKVIARVTPPYDIECLGTSGHAAIDVFDPSGGFPPNIGFDGIIGWPVFRQVVLLLQIWNHDVAFAPIAELPEASGGTDLKVLDAGVLILRFSDSADAPDIEVDTGSSAGVTLSPPLWRAWLAEHPDAPTTVQTSYLPADGFYAERVAWADELRLGPVVLHEVPVSEATASYTTNETANRQIVVLGTTALTRLTLVVDAARHRARMWPRSEPPDPVDHNRAGVAFVPQGGKALELVAHVAPRTPAAEADIRDGDILVSENGRSAEEWWKNRDHREKSAAGVRVELVVKRGEVLLHRSFVTRDIIGPPAKS